MRILLLAAVVLVSACRSKPESPEYAAFRMSQESAAAQTAIDAINIRYMRYMNGNMADSIASLYMDDATLMPPNAPPVVGKEGIRLFYAEHPLPDGARITFAAAGVSANGTMLVELGEYELALPAAGQSPATEIRGKYLAHWRNVDGRWLQAAQIWNENAPAPATATP